MHFGKIIFLITTVELIKACGSGRRFYKNFRRQKLEPLVFKQHVPNYSEQSIAASGKFSAKVRRDSKEFKKLAFVDESSDIIFKDNEGTGADRLMTQRCKDKLNSLSIMVANEWPGVKVRVIEAYDEDDQHQEESLHYEGRALDITTSDVDKSKYGMLARLAVLAGFDWVYYENRYFVHCSCKPDNLASSFGGGCFSLNSTVLTDNGVKTLQELKKGDFVQTINSDGQPLLTEFLTFLHFSLDTLTPYNKLILEDGTELLLTDNHLIYTRRGGMIFSRDLKINDELRTDKEYKKINSKERVMQNGYSAPLTKHGTLLVNGLWCSCYAEVSSHDIAHFSMKPIRLLPIFTENVINYYVWFLVQIGRYTLPESYWFDSHFSQ